MKLAHNLKFVPRIINNKGRSMLYMIFFITSRCNMRCSHCFFWKEINKEKEMTIQQIEKISKTIDPLLYLRLTGGEPFLRDDVYEIAKLFHKNANLKNLGINTNGYFHEKIVKTAEKILSDTDVLLDIGVSIDDLKEKHDKNRGLKGAYDNARKTIKGLNELKKKYPNLSTTIVITVTGENQDRLKEIFEELKKIGPSFITCNLIRGSPKDPLLMKVDYQKYLDFIDLTRTYNSKKQHQFYLNAGLKDKMQSKIITKTLKENRYQGIDCSAANKIAVLYSNGDLFPCEPLEDRKIGNLKNYDYDMNKLWKSKKRKDTEKWIINSKCFCTHECFLSTSLLLTPMNLIKGSRYLVNK